MMTTNLRIAFRCVMLVSFVLIAMVAGCKDAQSPQDKAMAEWAGAPAVAVIQGWGQPDKVFADGSSGFVLCYVNRWNFVHYNALYNEPATDGSGDTAHIYGLATKMFEQSEIDSYRAYRVFYLEADGTVYDSAWRGKESDR
jgi:hypothetical protein